MRLPSSETHLHLCFSLPSVRSQRDRFRARVQEVEGHLAALAQELKKVRCGCSPWVVLVVLLFRLLFCPRQPWSRR